MKGSQREGSTISQKPCQAFQKGRRSTQLPRLFDAATHIRSRPNEGPARKGPNRWQVDELSQHTGQRVAGLGHHAFFNEHPQHRSGGQQLNPGQLFNEEAQHPGNESGKECDPQAEGAISEQTGCIGVPNQDGKDTHPGSQQAPSRSWVQHLQRLGPGHT
jgi:hypothetical protein